MNNFGVLEVASARRSVAPGWAYVPDTPAGFGSFTTTMTTTTTTTTTTTGKAGASNHRKRAARSQAGTGLASYSDLTSRQESKLRKELEVLERDGGAGVGPRDAAIPIPAKAVKAQNKHTPTVRKILASQKTFANHLDDFLAMAALYENSHSHGPGHNDGTPGGRATSVASASASATAAAAETAPVSGRGKRAAKKEAAKRESKKRQSVSVATATATATTTTATTTATTTPAGDTPMPDASASSSAEVVMTAPTAAAASASASTATTTTTTTPPPRPPLSAILRPYTGPRPTPHPLDDDPLLVSHMPPLPTDDELRALLAAPPLTYAEARATWPTENDATSGRGGSAPERRYPARVFCEICGYWGRIKCTKCGTPLCALDCLETHREDCITRYGL